jgi:hypothetical protein
VYGRLTVVAVFGLRWPSLVCPWEKASLHAYQEIVSQARNDAFHHALPFDATVEIDLLDQNVRAEKIRLFLPFGEKQGRGIRVQDQELADVWPNFLGHGKGQSRSRSGKRT